MALHLLTRLRPRLIAALLAFSALAGIDDATAAKALLTRSDFTYVGTTLLPYAVDGLTTMYSSSGLALRRVNGELRAFVAVSGRVLEFKVTAPGVPLTLVRNHGQIWRPYVAEPQALTAMHFRQTAPDGSGQLWFAHGYFYHVTGSNDPHVSVATFQGEQYVSSAGPFVTGGTQYNKTRSGITSWMDGKLLIGAGGHFAGVSTASLGLFAGAFDPVPASTLPVTPLVDHPYASGTWGTSQRRMGDYTSTGDPHSPDYGTWPQPTSFTEPSGKWQYYDGIDTFVYVDTGTAHGLVSMGEEATGPITYDAGGSCVGCRFRSYWRVFDPAKVAANGGRTLEPESYWRFGPGGMGDPDYGRVLPQHKDGQNLPLGTGIAYDAQSGMVVQFYAKLQKLSPTGPDYERLPGLMFYRVGPGTPPPTGVEICGDNIDNDGDGQVDEGCVTPLLAPGAPQALKSRVSGTTVYLEWQAPITGGAAAGYVVEAGVAAGQTTFTLPLAKPNVTVQNVGRGTYYVRVKAGNAAGTGAASNEVAVTVGCDTRPRAPKRVKSSVNGQIVSVTWVDADGCGGTGYTVSIGSAPGAANLASFDTADPQFLAQAQPGTYYARVVSVSEFGPSTPSEEVRFEVGDNACTPPTLAMLLSAAVRQSQVTLSWTPADPGAASAADVFRLAFVLEVGTGPGLADIGTIPMGRAVSFTALAPPGNYYVRVRPVDQCGTGTPSNEIVMAIH